MNPRLERADRLRKIADEWEDGMRCDEASLELLRSLARELEDAARAEDEAWLAKRDKGADRGGL